jgi:hypothetical protein
VSAAPGEPVRAVEENVKLYREFVAELDKRQLSGSENFDKSVLTLSSAGLGLSISFLKDFAAFKSVELSWMLYTSWGLFTLATVCTMFSFLASGWAMEAHKGLARRAYMEGDENAFDVQSGWGRLTGLLNITSAVAFMFALIATVVFITTNIESKSMATGINRPVNTPDLAQKGLPTPTMHRPVSAPAPAPAPVSSPSAASPAPAQPASE